VDPVLVDFRDCSLPVRLRRVHLDRALALARVGRCKALPRVPAPSFQSIGLFYTEELP